MTAKANHSTPTKIGPAPLVLFGLDSRGKPKAARFSKEHAGLAIKAASQLALQVVAGSDPKLAEIAARLPVGRVHATGRAFVPFIHRDLYDLLLAAAANGAAPSDNPSNGSSGGSGSTPSGSAPHSPKDWQEIGVGDLVVAQDSLEDGWYDAIVVLVDGDMLTLRWRDYPRERRVVRHRLRLALLYPGPKPSGETGKSAKAAGRAKHDKTVETNHAANGLALPKDWDEIDLNHLVLAKTEGPGANWFEAIPIERAGDGFKLRWRDYVTLPPVIRPRFDLALICPDAA